jgi:hypothetical protein
MPRLSLQQKIFGRFIFVAAVVCFIAGGLTGYLQGPASPEGAGVRVESRLLPQEIPQAVAIGIIGRYQHWGDNQRNVDAGSVSAGLDLAKSFQMVGLEQHVDQQVVLLLFSEGGAISADRLAVKPDAENVLRLREGDQLIEGVYVSGVAPGAVTLTGNADVKTEAAQGQASLSWTLTMYPKEEDVVKDK